MRMIARGGAMAAMGYLPDQLAADNKTNDRKSLPPFNHDCQHMACFRKKESASKVIRKKGGDQTQLNWPALSPHLLPPPYGGPFHTLWVSVCVAKTFLLTHDQVVGTDFLNTNGSTETLPIPTSELPIMIPALSPAPRSTMSSEMIFKNMWVSSSTNEFT